MSGVRCVELVEVLKDPFSFAILPLVILRLEP